MKQNSKGELYICPTPIGNMKDISNRVVECLEYVDLVACEDTRNAKKLLNQLGIKKPLISYHKFNQEGKGREITKKLEEGKKIAVISDAGTPAISDPGSYLVADAVEKGIKIISIPGPSAVITALSASGITADKFYFIGFIPKRGSKRNKAIFEILNANCTVIFYESPNRVFKTLQEIAPKISNRKIIVAKEVSKIYEEYIRGCGEDILKKLEDKNLKGEMTVIVEGKSVEGKNGDEIGDEITDEEIEEHIKNLIEKGLSKKDAVKSLVDVSGLSKNKVYEIALKI